MPLTHFDAEGKARMVDVTEKKETVREATATGKIKVSRDVYDAIEAGTVGKGDVLSVATTAGIMGVKRTADPFGCAFLREAAWHIVWTSSAFFR